MVFSRPLAVMLTLALTWLGCDDGEPGDADADLDAASDAGADADADVDADADAASDADTDADADADGDADAASDADGDADRDADGDEGWSAPVERCDLGGDEDGDGLVDEGCPPSLFSGVYLPEGATDPALEALEADVGADQSVVQTYRSMTPLGLERLGPDLAAIWGRGAVPHLNVEPSGYTAAQYAAAATDPAIGADLAALADALVVALEASGEGRLLFTFGAEMNGNWVDWGCLPAATFVGFYRRAHDAVATALDGAAIDRRRVRWVYGPNSTSSGGCGSAAAYYPGHAHVDYLGMSAYRSGTATVGAAVTSPALDLLDDLAYPDAWRSDRFIVLQTGTRDVGGDDRGAWLATLYDWLADEDVFAGVIYFDADDWAVVDAGYDDWVAALAALPRADPRLDPVFEPFFWDVPAFHPAYAEIQALRAAGLTSGCEAAPPLFCPDTALLRRDAAVLLQRAFGVEPEPEGEPLFDDVPASSPAFGAVQALARLGALPGCGERTFCPTEPVVEADLAAAIAALDGDAPAAATDAAALRGLGASWIVRGARVPPAPPVR